MRIAVCLHGISSGRSALRDKTRSNPIVSWKEFVPSIMRNVCQLPKNRTDFFIHTWDNPDVDDIIETYQPLLWMHEPQKDFNKFHNNDITEAHKSDFNAYTTANLSPIIYAHSRLFSQWYSFDYADRLRQVYELKNKFKYDFVVKCRFDLEFLKPIAYETYSKDNIYVGKWWGNHPYGMEDLFVVTGPENMTAISRMYQKLYQYYMDPEFEQFIRGKGLGCFHFCSPHELMYYHFMTENLLPKIVEQYTREVDFTLKRDKTFNFEETNKDK